MDLGLTGRTALVGGASSGLGRACAERLAAEGCRLALWSRGGEALARAAAEIRSRHGAEVTTIAADASDPAAAAQVAREAEDALGRVDVLILNAGGPPTANPDQTDPEAWRRALQLLAISPIELATRLLPAMRANHWGRIVSILSSGVRQPIPNLAYSNASRSALAAWLKTIAPEVAAEGVTVNGVMPGRIDTPRVAQLDQGAAEREGTSLEEVRRRLERAIPAGRYGQPDELAAYVAYLCSDAARYHTGTFVAIDGGMLRALP